jgi:hypothetical protein
MKKIDGDIKAARDSDKECISLLRYVFLEDEFRSGKRVIFLRNLKCRRQFMRAARNRETISAFSLLRAACGNTSVGRFAAARFALTPMRCSTVGKAYAYHSVAERAQSEYDNE